MSDDIEFDPRRADEGQSFEWADTEGTAHTMKADADGVLRPRNADEARIADLFGLPVARSVKQAEKAAPAPADSGNKEK